VKYWEIIASNLKKRGWSLGYVSAVDSGGRTIFVADANHKKQARIPNSDRQARVPGNASSDFLLLP
jgi:hypothetical protein